MNTPFGDRHDALQFQVISLFGAGFAGGFSTHIMDRIKERREEKKKKRHSSSGGQEQQ